jgi:hypothetical protein
MKKFLIGILLFSMFLIKFPVGIINVANAASPGSVVINEVTWMGTVASSTEEWIELYNTTSSDIDLTGWTIDDDNGADIYTITSGTILAGDYFLIEDSVINLSLGNTGDSLVLKDDLAQTIDTVNSTGGAWFAGDNTNKYTMERVDPNMDGDDSANWADSTVVEGTPGAVNSVFAGAPADPEVLIEDLTVNPVEGDSFNLTVSIASVTDAFSYGFDIIYDPAILAYTGSTEGTFLNESGTVQTSFNEGLENGTQGKAVIGNSRLTSPATGVSGSGDLFTLNFDAIASGSTSISFDTASFVSDTTGDITVTMDSDTVTIDPQTIDPATNLTITEGANRYELTLNWDAPVSGADSYQIFRRDQAGTFTEIANIAATSYTDSNNLIPTHNYEYQVITVKGSLESTPASANSADSRGIKGDNNRSDRVDGRDLNNLALHYTQTLSDPDFDALIDTTYDGQIDGSDLIDIGANWAITY